MSADTAMPRETEDEAGLDPEFEALLDYVKRSRGFDFTGYKRASLRRRVDKEMASVGIPTYADYVDHLEVYPDGFARLFNTVLINVTSFFRDAPVWEHLSADVLPQILAAKPHGEPIRVWSAGCASGQEPYSLAIALAELLGPEAFRERVKIYATDVDEEALAHARTAAYSPREAESLPPDLRERYTEPEAGRSVIRKDLRRVLIFGRHDLLQDAPISRIDLLLCRNTIMYFNSEVQSRIMDRFHFALNDGGFLVLGKAEMPFAHGGLFGAGDMKKRIFVKIPRQGLRDRVPLMPPSSPDGAAPDPALRLRETAFNAAPVAQIVVDAEGRLALANERARALFGLAPRDLGRPIQDLEVSYRPVELRSCIERVSSERQTVSVREARWMAPGGVVILDVLVAPLLDDGVLRGVSVSFTDVTRARQLSEELLEAGRELETAYEELQSTNEELETTNEELQSTNEELETTNEELQSTNEELETTNEELQSTNEELETTNEEMRLRSVELGQVNAFLESILSSQRGGVVVLDADLRVQRWNGRSEDLWGLRADEAQGRPFLTLDIGLPVGELLPAIRSALADGGGGTEVVVTARNRRGRDFPCRVVLTPLAGDEPDTRGVILLMEEQPAQEQPAQEQPAVG